MEEIENSKVVRFTWHPASDSKPDRMTVKFLFDFKVKTLAGLASLNYATLHTVSDSLDERLAVTYLESHGLKPVGKFEYQNKLFVIIS